MLRLIMVEILKCTIIVLLMGLLKVIDAGGPHYCSPGHAWPCQNGGNCIPYNNGHDYVCVCLEGFKGDNCDYINCSSPRYCVNGGTCHEINGGLAKTCSCYYGWKGDNCELTDECTPYKEADIVFVIDTSLSMTSHLPSQKEYVKNFVSKFQDGPKNYRYQFSVVTYSFNATVHFYLKAYDNYTVLFNDIDHVTSADRGPSMTAKALRLVREDVLAPGKGIRAAVDQYVILLTDGLSSEPMNTSQEAILLKAAGVQLYVLGAGEYVAQEELRDIASGNMRVYPMSTPDALHNVLSNTMLGCKECTSMFSDVALVMDVSSGTDKRALDTQLKAASYIIKATSVSFNHIQFSYLTFSHQVNRVYNFDSYYNKSDLIGEMNVQTRLHTGSGYNVTHVLQYMYDNGFDVATGARQDTRRIIVLFTSGNFTMEIDSVRAKASMLRDRGDVIVTLGVGSSVSVDNLQDISSDKTFTYWFDDGNDDITSLDTLISTIMYTSCKHFT